MKTLPDLLRETDPLGYEPRRSAQERRISRQRVLNGLDEAQERPRWRIAIVAAVLAIAVTSLGIAAGSRYWPRIAVDAVAAVRFEVRLAEDHLGNGLREAGISSTGRKVYLHEEAIVTNSDIVQANVIQGETPSRFNVSVVFNPAGAQKISRATGGHVGKPLAILVDGDVVIAPVVKAPITTSAIISGNYTKAEAERIVAGILGR